MNTLKYNTKKNGLLTFLIFKDGDDYCAVCMNLNIVEYGKDPKELKNSIEEAARSYVLSIRSKNLSDDLLNQIPEAKYIQVYKSTELRDELLGKKMKKSSLFEKNPKNININISPYKDQHFFLSN